MAVYKINESKKVTESYDDGTVSIDQLREAISNLEELVSEMEINDIDRIKASPNTYGLGSFFLGTSSGYIDLNDVYSYMPGTEDYEEGYNIRSGKMKESLTEAKSPRRVLIAKAIRKNSGNYGFDYCEYIYAYPSKSGKGFTCIVATDVGNYILCNCKELTPEKVEATYHKRYDPDYKSDFEWYQDNVDKLLSGSFSESLTEATDPQDYRVYQISMDVAVPGDQGISAYGLNSSGNGKLFHALSQTLKSEGLEMAGDFIFADDYYEDLTATYKDNDYKFFEESFRTRRGRHS